MRFGQNVTMYPLKPSQLNFKSFTTLNNTLKPSTPIEQLSRESFSKNHWENSLTFVTLALTLYSSIIRVITKIRISPNSVTGI